MEKSIREKLVEAADKANTLSDKTFLLLRDVDHRMRHGLPDLMLRVKEIEAIIASAQSDVEVFYNGIV